jgi:chlorobenzene dioxygenase small subunit/benzene/toluene dioxygenase beta subunit
MAPLDVAGTAPIQRSFCERGWQIVSAVQEKLPARCAPGTAEYGEIVEFLYREAEMLDDHRFSEWIALFTEDVRYDMPVRTTQVRAKGEGFEDVGFFDENIHSLRIRVRRLQTGTAWAESPPSRTRHFISNVLATVTPGTGEYFVRSSFIVARTRAEQGYQMFTGRREDSLRRGGSAGFLIARRRILIDQTVITATNLSILF